MTASTLVAKLTEIARAADKGDPAVIPALVLEAQDCVLVLQRQMLEMLRDNERLRQRMENCERSLPMQAWMSKSLT